MFERSNSASLRASMRSLLLPSLSRAFRRGLHTTSSVTCGLIRSYNQAAQVPSSKVTCRLPRRPLRKSRMVMALVSIVDSMTSLPEEFSTAIEIASLCTSIPIYFTLSIEGAPFCCGFDANTQNPTPKGAPFYIASRNRTSPVPLPPFPAAKKKDSPSLCRAKGRFCASICQFFPVVAALNRPQPRPMNLVHDLLIGYCAINECIAADHVLLIGHSDGERAVREPHRDELSVLAAPLSRNRCTRLGRL